MLTVRQRLDRGDTLIEVLFAVTVFSLVVVGALALMNQGTATSQRALEMTLVTQQVDNQTETLRFLHEAYVTNYQPGYATSPGLTVDGATGQFYEIVHLTSDAAATQASTFTGLDACPTPPSGSFVLNTHTATVIDEPTIFAPAETFARLNFDPNNAAILANSGGIWIEGIRSPETADPSTSRTGFIDFHIRACWDAPGLSKPTTFGTIVRLYEPRS